MIGHEVDERSTNLRGIEINKSQMGLFKAASGNWMCNFFQGCRRKVEREPSTDPKKRNLEIMKGSSFIFES